MTKSNPTPTPERKCCEKCWNSKHALKGKNKAKMGCGLVCECHRREPVVASTPESRLREEWRALCAKGAEESIYLSIDATADHWLGKLSQEREALVGEVEGLRKTANSSTYLYNQGEKYAYDKVLALLTSKN